MELQHHGIKGMKWGVRRYRNYDGSYTKEGVRRYDKASENYENARNSYKTAKSNFKNGSGSKQDVKSARVEYKKRRKNLNEAYDHIKLDNRADKGKALYAKGKTITGNSMVNMIAQAGIVIGSKVVNDIVAKKSNDPAKAFATSAAVAAGGTAVNAILAGKTTSDNRNLRAYYGHSYYKEK